MSTPAIEQAAEPVVTAAQGLFVVLTAAEMRGLPMPMCVRAYDYTPVVDLQFRTRDEVVPWAEVLEAEIEDDTHVHPAGVNDTAKAHGEWFEVPVEVCCSVRRAES